MVDAGGEMAVGTGPGADRNIQATRGAGVTATPRPNAETAATLVQNQGCATVATGPISVAVLALAIVMAAGVRFFGGGRRC